MKKLWIGLLILVLAGAGIFWFFFYSNRNYPETVLPQNSAAYLYFAGADQVRKEGPQTLLWQKIANSPRKKLYQNQLQRLIRFTESVIGVDPVPLLQQFTREVALSVLPVSQRTQSGALVAYIRKEKATREFLEMKLDPALKRRFPDLKKAPVKYLENEYYKYSSNAFRSDLSPCYILLDHHLIATSSEAAMKILLDVKAKKVASLKQNEVFDDAKEEVHFKKGILFFINAKSMLEVLKNGLPARVQPFWPAFLKISGVESVQAFTYRVGLEGQGFREEGYVSVDRKREGFASAYMQQKPQKLAGLNFLPADSEVAGAGTLPDASMVWKEVQSQIETVLSGSQFSQVRTLLEFIGSFLNVNFEKDLVEPIGRQFSFASHSHPDSSNVQDKRYFIALELKQPDRFRGMMEKLIQLGEQRGFQRQAQLYQGKTLQILKLASNPISPSPTMWVEGSWFYVGTDQDAAKKAIDAVKNRKNLPSNADFQRVTSGFPAEVNGISYTNIQASLKKYATLLNAETTETERMWIREYGLVEEMNELSKSLFGSGSYTMIEKDGVRYQSYSSIPTSLFLLPSIASAASR